MKLSAAKIFALALFPLASAMLTGCGASTSVAGAGAEINSGSTVVDGGVPTDPFVNFSARLLGSAGSQAQNCGVVRANNPSSEADQCVADMFNASTPFYAIYEQSGIDSTVADGVSLDAAGVLQLWSFDSNIAGGASEGSERISNRVCTLPSMMNLSAQSLEEKFGCFISLQQFQQQMTDSTGTDPLMCGTVEIDQSPQVTDNCVKDALANDEAFVATYMLRGIDSTVAQGLSSSANGVSFFWSYDSSITGQGDQGPSRVGSTYCREIKSLSTTEDAALNPGFSTESVLERFSCDS